jgi:hypothetical protein
MKSPPKTLDEKKLARRARNARYYAKKKQDPAWRAEHNRKCREASSRLYERRAAFGRQKKGGVKGLTGYSIVNARDLASPNLRWRDQHGSLHYEDTRTAEEVIEAWRKKQPEG